MDFLFMLVGFAIFITLLAIVKMTYINRSIHEIQDAIADCVTRDRIGEIITVLIKEKGKSCQKTTEEERGGRRGQNK